MNTKNHDPAHKAKTARQYIGVGNTLFYTLVKKGIEKGGLPPGIKLSDRCTVWRQSDLDKFLEERAAASRGA